MRNNEDYLFREIAWSALVGPNSNPKKLPKSKQQFWPLVSDKKKKAVLNEKMMKRIKEAQDKYFRELKEKSNG